MRFKITILHDNEVFFERIIVINGKQMYPLNVSAALRDNGIDVATNLVVRIEGLDD